MLRKSIIVLVLGLLLAAPASARKYKGDDTMLVSPYVFFTGFKGISLTIHTEVDFSEVVRESVVLTGAGTEAIEPYLLKRDNRGDLVAKFTADEVSTIVEAPRTTLTLHGTYGDGGTFELTASIRVWEPRR